MTYFGGGSDLDSLVLDGHISGEPLLLVLMLVDVVVVVVVFVSGCKLSVPGKAKLNSVAL